MRADDKQKMQLESSYVPTPILEERLTHSFRVSSLITIKYVLGTGCSADLSNTYPRDSDMRISLKVVELYYALWMASEILRSLPRA